MGKYRMTEPWGYQEVQGYVGNESKESNSKEIEELKNTKVDGAEYKKGENKISLTAEGKEVASIDTTDFVKDGMVESVELDGTVLKMVFNTDAGKEEIDIDFKDIVSGGSYYTKDEVDAKLDEKADKSDIPSLDEYAKTADVQAEIDNAVSGKADTSDVYTKDEADAKLDEKADKADIPSLDEYAKSADVQAEIENAVSGKADSSDVEAVESQITQILSDITALNGKDDELQANIDLKAGQNDLVAETERASAKESEIEENVAKKVDWVESTPGRNHIVLKNHDSVLGTATDGSTYNLAMVSKWDVADFGSAQLHANLNSKDGIVTINDDKAIATKDEVEAVDAKVEAIDLTSYAKSEDVNAELANKANASDLDALSATFGELSGKVDEKALQSDLDAFEASSTEALGNEIARAEAKEAELAAKDEAQDAEIVKKVDWVESTPGRNHIVLKNHDSVLGTATDGSTYNLAMVSKWDVADFGSAQLHANLNSKDGSVTINDDKVVATKDEVEAVDAKVNAIDLTPFAKIEDMNAAVEALNAKDAELEAAIPTAAAQAVAQVVADAPEDLDTLKEVADYIAADKTKATEIETKLSALEAKDADQDAVISGKVDRNMNGTNGKALIFNESDGGGAKFEHNDGTWSFAGVNDGGENGIAGQIYAVKKNADGKMEGTRIDVTKGAMYYTVGAASAAERMTEANEIAVKGDIDAAVNAIEIPSIEGLAKSADVTAEIASAVAPLAVKADVDAALETKADADKVYTQDEVNNMLAEKQAEIDTMAADFKKLKEIVGDLGGAVEYSVPADGKLTDMLKKSGVIKLTEDVESNTYAGGITSKNITTLNLNGKTITTTANTTTNPSIMVRGAQQFTIQGGGTLNANGHIAIEANGEDAVITLGGTMFGRPTYVTNREGELIYCYLGTINITNGVFRNDNENKAFLLNCYDANYRNGTAKIIVTGGKFYDFDPANNTSEGEGTSYVPEGYVSVESTETIDGVEHTVYTVKKA